MSKVDENMKRAHNRGAVLKEKFFFRNHVVPLAEECGDDENATFTREDNAINTENAAFSNSVN